MSKKFNALALVLLAGFAAACTNLGSGGGGGTVEVNYQSPEQFTDMGRMYSSARGADEGYLEELRQHITRTGSARLPAGYTLSVTITDVDMAGQFEPERGPRFTDVRMVRAIYPPRIHLTYRLTDSNGAVRSEGERRLSDQSFDWKVSPIDRDDPLRHEKALIDDFISDIAREAR
jgi:hypothetical protein